MRTRWLKGVLASSTLLLLGAPAVNAALYTGNGQGSGVVGNGTLQLTDDATRIYGTFTKGGGSFDRYLVIYFDTQPGGFSGTSSFADTTSDITKSISGVGTVGRSVANFAPGFTADYALAFTGELYLGGQLYRLASGGEGSLEHVASINQSPVNSVNEASYTFRINWSDLGLTSGSGFRFQSTYLNPTGYRYLDSFETLTGTAGVSTIDFTDFNVYGTPVPEPAQVALAIFGAGFVTVGVVRRAIRSGRKTRAGS